jgi:hypothetical protein
MNPRELRLKSRFGLDRIVAQIIAVTTPTFAVYYDPETEELWSVKVLCWALCGETRGRHNVDEDAPAPRQIVTGLVDYEGSDLRFVDEICESDLGEFLYYSNGEQTDLASIDEPMKEEVDRRRKSFAGRNASQKQE